MAQPCHLHQVELLPGGRRVGVVGFVRVFDYFAAEAARFPRANALRIGACNGRVRGRPRVMYCPRCREELQAWCRETVEANGTDAWLAARMLEELFRVDDD